MYLNLDNYIMGFSLVNMLGDLGPEKKLAYLRIVRGLS
jgi:hypothetical protein